MNHKRTEDTWWNIVAAYHYIIRTIDLEKR